MLEEKRLAFIRREIDWIRRAPCARGTKQQARVQRFEAAYNQEALRRSQDVSMIIPPPAPTGNVILELNGVSLSLGGKLLFSDLSLAFEPGMKLGIVGRNGLGKTSLLKVMQGLLALDSGSVRIGERPSSLCRPASDDVEQREDGVRGSGKGTTSNCSMDAR